ncbi:flavin reductase family protein [Arcobacter sp. HD9-500m-PIT-SAG03]|nr:flavin reductase family protein [Arcobacter sp. HD9-500m-PIT-SAG03]
MENFLTIDPKDTHAKTIYSYLVSAVASRPIAFASTIDKEGNVNLSPFSFFNVFSANPPIMIFSPVRRSVDNTIKDSLKNVYDVKEVVINIVNYNMVQQMSLSSADYPSNINEFDKSGLTMLESDLIKPYRVKESPVQFECKVLEIKKLGDKGGAGNLVICEVVKIHLNEDILLDNNMIDPHKIDLVARAGGNYYSRVADGYFEIPKPFSKLGMGFDNLPSEIKNSTVLSGNDLGKLASLDILPSISESDLFKKENSIVIDGSASHVLAKQYLKNDEIENAWKILL